MWVDEAGFYLLPAVVRTYAPVGQTPILREWWTRDHLSAIAAISPEGKLYFRSQDHAIDSAGVVEWTPNGLVVSSAGSDQISPTMVLDAGGAIVAWEDGRSGFSSDIYAQRITASGVVGPTVGVSGEKSLAFEMSAARPNMCWLWGSTIRPAASSEAL